MTSLLLQSSTSHEPENYVWKKIYNTFCCLCPWVGGTLKNLEGSFDEFYKTGSSNGFQNIDPVIEFESMKLIAAIIVLCRYAVMEYCDLELHELSGYSSSFSSSGWSTARYIQVAHQFLQNVDLNKILNLLFQELKSIEATDKRHYDQQKEVLHRVSKNVSPEQQQGLFGMSRREVALELLECVHTSLLSDPPNFLSYELFAFLLVMWRKIDYPGNIPIKKFGKDLMKISGVRFSLPPKQIKEAVNMQTCSKFRVGKMRPVVDNKQKHWFCPSFSSSSKAKMHDIYYSSERKFRPCRLGQRRTSLLAAKFDSEETSAAPPLGGVMPMDSMLVIQKALKKDLEYLIFESAKLAENVACLVDFREQFQLLQLRRRFCIDVMDQIVFPALEAKEKLPSITHSYTTNHETEVKYFSEVSLILDEMLDSHYQRPSVNLCTNFKELCLKLHDTCQSLHESLSGNVGLEEAKIWPLFREILSMKEQEKIIASILGRTSAEMLQDIIYWLTSFLTNEEHGAMMLLWRKIAKNTMFDDWLSEWWKGHCTVQPVENSKNHFTKDPLDIVSRYLYGGALDKGTNLSLENCLDANIKMLKDCSLDDERATNKSYEKDECSKSADVRGNGDNNRPDKVSDLADGMTLEGKDFELITGSSCDKHLLATIMNQDDLEATMRRVASDSSLDLDMKSKLMQDLLTSRWLVQKQRLLAEAANSSKSDNIAANSSESNNIAGQHPSYRDHLKMVFGCKHYKRNCKLVTNCCNQLYTCIRCHDEAADHTTERRTMTRMMCMKCLVIQQIAQKCSTVSCNNFSMAKYYCRICKLFDDEREIYHCPYCNLCRVGKGLGIDYFHCMNCNACLSRSLSVHVCREKCLEANCPICHEYLFTSTTPVKALPCGHLMHSTCFKEYTYTHYTCPICFKSLGDMQVYFQMLDEVLAGEKMPEEYTCKTQVILCNDCEKRGSAPFHWLYHKCSYCGSYNTRLF